MFKNWLLPSCMAILAGFSILTLRSVAPGVAAQQTLFFAIGFVIFIVTSRLPLSWLVKGRWLAYAVLCVLLVVPLLIGETTRGIKAWIDIGPWFSIQPSQLAIPIVAVVMAVGMPKQGFTSVLSILRAAAIIVLPAILMMLEPDLGTTVVYLLSLGAILFINRLPWSIIGGMLVLGIVTSVFAWQFALQPYQKLRITSFLGQNVDTDASYNARQSLIAVGSGQGWGRGVGQGIQSHLRFLPERQTDFVFASLAEEWGFLGTAVVLITYTGIVYWLFRVAIHATAPWQASYCYGLVVMFAVQAGINMGMNMGLVPITGITLPLLSYGGSSVLAVCGSLGLAMAMQRQIKPHSTAHFS